MFREKVENYTLCLLQLFSPPFSTAPLIALKMFSKMHSINSFFLIFFFLWIWQNVGKNATQNCKRCDLGCPSSLGPHDSGILNSLHCWWAWWKTGKLFSPEAFPVMSFSSKPTEIRASRISRILIMMLPVNESEPPSLFTNHRFAVYCSESSARLFLFRC